MKKHFLLLLVAMIAGMLAARAQSDLSSLFADSLKNNGPVIATFKSDELINTQTNETLHKHDLIFEIGHRFGDIGGQYGGAKTFFGFDNISDVSLGFGYGITDRFSVGIGRAKGAPNGVNSTQLQLYYGSLKYRLLQQTVDNRIPVAITLFGRELVSAMQSQPNNQADGHFSSFSNRLSSVVEMILARKFSDRFSLDVLPTYIHRGVVAPQDMSDMFALGFGGRLKFTEHMALVADYFLPFRNQTSTQYYENQFNFRFYHPLAVGIEIETGGHVFHIDFTNATALLENQLVTSTSSNWTNGQFRWGFNFSRTFTLGGTKRKW